AGLAGEAAAKHSRGKSAHADKSDKSEGKTGKHAGKKTAGKSRDKHDKDNDKKSASDKSTVPQIPLAEGPPPQTADADIARVKQAIEGLRRNGASKATGIQAGMSDPVARKLVEWLILRSDHNGADSTRYRAFIAANPNWPRPALFRRRTEAMLWVENVKPAQ